MSFPKYPKYKDSGVEWLGEVPEHWGFAPLKHLAEFINGDAFKPSEWAESGIPIVRIQNPNGSEEFNYFAGGVESRYLVHDGDLLFGWSGNRGKSFGPFLWRRAEVCALNQHIFRVVPKSLFKSVLFWTLKAVTAHVEDQAHGIIGMVHVTKGDLGSIAVPVPPIEEQTLIANFLDRETSKIDALVGEHAPIFETPEGATRVVLFSHKSLNEMDRADRVRACYLHACLRYVERNPMTNSSLRERFGIDKRNSATASRIINEALEDGCVKRFVAHRRFTNQQKPI